MLLNKKKFYQEIANYYERDNYKGAEVFLADKEKELKLAVMPDPGCFLCGNVDADEDGLAPVTKEWIKERNEAISIVNYEQGRIYQAMERWEESLRKYEDAKKLMERNNLTHENIYSALIENMKLVKEK